MRIAYFDPFSGDIYQRFAGTLYRYTGAEWKEVTTIPFNISQVASVALAWWSGPFPGAGGHGVLTVYSGNAGTISAFDPTTGQWLPDLVNMLPGQLGNVVDRTEATRVDEQAVGNAVERLLREHAGQKGADGSPQAVCGDDVE